MAAGLDGGMSEACRATFQMLKLGWLVGIDGGTRAELCGATCFRILDLGWRLGTMAVRSEAVAERHLSECSKQGGWWGLMVVGQSEALAERPDLN